MTTSTTTTSPSSPTSADIAGYAGLVSAIASRLAGTRRARRAGAEYDDLYQEGLIAVWQSFQRNVNPALVIENRMNDWVRFVSRYREPVEYGAMLPLEEIPSGGAG